ncbi:MFS transporter [Paenibacillus sp. HN-1]|nr:MFS transporter [Paenibacillus sp. CGMCC 1.18879]MBY9084849.1 MFS transporter [Paenibacillus sinensis]
MFAIYGTCVLALSYFPLFYSHLGFSSAQVGVLYSIGPLISMLSNLFWSMLSDRLGTVRKIMFILLAGQLVTALLLSQATEFSTVMVILSCFYFFYYPVYPLADTMAIQTAERRGRNFITIRLFGSLGYAFFALSMGYLLRSLGISWSITLCTIIIAVSLGIALLLRDAGRKRSRKTADEADRTPDAAKGLRAILLRREVIWFFACVFVLALSYRMNDAFLTVSMKHLGAGEELIGWALLASALSEIPVLFLLGKYGDKFKEVPLLVVACLMFGLRFLLMSSAQQPVLVILIQLMHSVTFGIFYVTSVRYITRLIPDHLRATGMAVYTVMWSSLSGLLSGAFGGLIYQHWGMTVFYRTAALLAVVAAAGFMARRWLAGSSILTAREPVPFAKPLPDSPEGGETSHLGKVTL